MQRCTLVHFKVFEYFFLFLIIYYFIYVVHQLSKLIHQALYILGKQTHSVFVYSYEKICTIVETTKTLYHTIKKRRRGRVYYSQ